MAGEVARMSIDDTITHLIYLPRNFNRRGNASMYSLLRDSGYFAMHDQVTEDALQQMLLRHPECVDEWMSFSEEKRASAGWFFRRGPKGYDVGYFPVISSRHQPVDYADGVAACAAFIKREIEDIRTEGKQP
jgi:hypothetical protein